MGRVLERSWVVGGLQPQLCSPSLTFSGRRSPPELLWKPFDQLRREHRWHRFWFEDGVNGDRSFAGLVSNNQFPLPRPLESSMAVIPVCIGSCRTGAPIPGAGDSTKQLSVVWMSPAVKWRPSVTTRPSMASPTGTWAILPVAVTKLLEFHLCPLLAVSSSRLRAITIVPSSNSNSSP